MFLGNVILEILASEKGKKKKKGTKLYEDLKGKIMSLFTDNVIGYVKCAQKSINSYN